jgi:hypothetical protein
MPKIRYPLAEAIMSRDGVMVEKDCYVQNGYMDKYNNKTYILRRPGTGLQEDFGVVSEPQGAFWYNGFIYAVYNDILYTSGGGTNSGSSGQTWTQASVPAWYGRSFFTATVFQNRIYVIGGEAPVQYADINYSQDGFVWSQNASAAPFGHRQGHQVVVFNNQMFLIGGLENDLTTTALKNDVWSTSDGATWTQLTAAAPWTARDNHTCVAANNGIYLYGGDTGGQTGNDDVWFTVDGITWTQLTTAATGTPRFLQSMMFFKNKLYIIGGIATGGATAIDEVDSSPDGQTWTVTAPVFGGGRYGMASTIYNNKMWLISGSVSGGGIDSNVYSSADGITWTLVTAAPGFGARGGASAVTFQTPSSVSTYRYPSMWLLGGNDGLNELQEVWYGNLDSVLAATYALSPDVSGQRYQFNTFLNGQQLLIKNESNFWVLQSGTLTKVVDTNYPTETVPGIVVLNLFAYVCTPQGELHACAIENPLLWPSLQFTTADYEDDPAVAIEKYLNYLVVFGTYTTQFYYDAGNPAPGIPLASYQSGSVLIGCAHAGTIAILNDTLIWVGQSKFKHIGVYMMNGLSPQQISTTWVDYIIELNVNDDTTSMIFSSGGHTFYVLANRFGTYIPVYDQSTKQWQPWNSNVPSSPSPWPYAYSVSDLGNFGSTYFFGSDSLGGKVYVLSPALNDDDGTPYTVQVQTDKVDNDNLMFKYWGQANLVADVNVGATSTLEYTDDDYNTYRTWGTFDEGRIRPYINRGGAARRRAFRLSRTDSIALRWEALEFNVSEGES